MLDGRGQVCVGEQGEAAAGVGHPAADGVALAAVPLIDEHATGDGRFREHAAGQVGGGVGASVIDDDDLRCPGLIGEVFGDAFEGGRESLLLIVGGDDDGQFDGCGLAHGNDPFLRESGAVERGSRETFPVEVPVLLLRETAASESERHDFGRGLWPGGRVSGPDGEGPPAVSR